MLRLHTEDGYMYYCVFMAIRNACREKQQYFSASLVRAVTT